MLKLKRSKGAVCILVASAWLAGCEQEQAQVEPTEAVEEPGVEPVPDPSYTPAQEPSQELPQESVEEDVYGPEGTQGLGPTATLSGEPTRLEIRQLEPYGHYLTDNNGRALYMFMADTQSPSQSNCYDACVEDWPLLTTDDEVISGPDVDPDLVGYLKRTTGATQVTYGGWPLYYYRGDASGNKVEGHDIMSHGAEWYLLSPQGTPIQHESGTSDSINREQPPS